jgi:hypothetical protein
MNVSPSSSENWVRFGAVHWPRSAPAQNCHRAVPEPRAWHPGRPLHSKAITLATLLAPSLGDPICRPSVKFSWAQRDVARRSRVWSATGLCAKHSFLGHAQNEIGADRDRLPPRRLFFSELPTAP